MSVDYSVICEPCKVCTHLGQISGTSPGLVFGYGSEDVLGREFVGKFIERHTHGYGPGITDLRIVCDNDTDLTPYTLEA